MRLAVPGLPVPQGSKKVVPTAAGPRLVDTNEKPLKSWRVDIAETAAAGGGRPLAGALRLTIDFYFPRPKGHYGKRGLLPSAPARPSVRPDLDKLARAVMDALTGIWFRDDAQIAWLVCRKHYADDSHRTPGVTVELEAL
jgi:crossover junction endodeoxyribonuclease RusA